MLLYHTLGGSVNTFTQKNYIYVDFFCRLTMYMLSLRIRIPVLPVTPVGNIRFNRDSGGRSDNLLWTA